MSGHIYKASKKRLLLAGYIDYLIFSTILELFLYFIDSHFDSYILRLIMFFIIESVLLWRFNSIGFYFLSIISETNKNNYRKIRFNPFRKEFFVKSNIFENETYFTILLGVIFILTGCKEIIGWTSGRLPLPYFGLHTTEFSSALFSTTFGIFVIFIGYLIFHLKRLTITAIIGYGIVYITAIISGWHRWGDVFKDIIVTKRIAQGRSVGEEEIQLIQAIVPEMLIFIIVIAIILVVINKKHFLFDLRFSTRYNSSEQLK